MACLAQPAAPCALLEARLHHPLVAQLQRHPERSRQPGSPEHAGGPEDQGQNAPKPDGLPACPAWSWCCSSRREFFGQARAWTSGYVAARNGQPATSIPARCSRRFRGTPANHGIAPLLKLENSAISGNPGTNLQYADGTLRVAAHQLGSLGATGQAADAPPESQPHGRRGLSRPRKRASREPCARWRSISSKALCERHRPPGSPSRRWPLQS